MDKQLFIKVQDKETSEKLLSEGFLLASFDGTTWTFVNDAKKKITFDNKKMVYSDKLCF
jgi:hypothetical protein